MGIKGTGYVCCNGKDISLNDVKQVLDADFFAPELSLWLNHPGDSSLTQWECLVQQTETY